MLEKLSSRGYPMRRSESAGRYLCEEALYTLEYLKSKAIAPKDVSFCHVPALGSALGKDRVTADYLQQFVVSYVTSWMELSVPPRGAAAERERARAEIQKLMETYFRSWSDQDLETYGDCFLKGAVIQYVSIDGEVLDVDLRDEFVAEQRKAHQDSPERMRESPERIDIHFEGRIARVAVQWRLEAGARRVYGYDHFTLMRRDGRWRIATLLFYADPSLPRAAPPPPAKPDPADADTSMQWRPAPRCIIGLQVPLFTQSGMGRVLQ
jgi:hypothetical protein